MAGAIVQEWISVSGGSERVVSAMAESLGDVDIYTLWNDDPDRFRNYHVYESMLRRRPFRGHKALSIPLQLGLWRRLRPRRAYDWMLVSSHLFAHHARFIGEYRDIAKYVYAHTPARYIWEPSLDARGSKILPRVASSVLRPLDRMRAQEDHALAANSEFVRQRIQSTWHRDAVVIPPPVDVERISEVRDWTTMLSAGESRTYASLPDEFILGASRFIPYKRLDLVIKTAAVADIPAVIAGDGPELEHLTAMARSAQVPVQIVRAPSDALLYALYQAAKVFVFPPVEDFGIMPIEALAAGCPVVTGPVGGASESLASVGLSGVAASLEPQDLAQQIDIASRGPRWMNSKAAQRFSKGKFVDALRTWMSIRH